MKKANSPSGIIAVSIIRLQDVVSFRIRRGVAYVAIKEGASFEDIPISKTGTLNFQDAPYGIEVNVPTPDASNTKYLSSIVGIPVIVKVEMLSAIYYIGSDRFPAKVSFCNTNSVEIGNYAGYVLKASAMDVSLHGDCTVVAITDPVTPPTDPVTPPSEVLTKFPLTATPDTYNSIGWHLGSIVGAILDCQFDDRQTDPTFDYTSKIATSNNADAFIFENKAIFPTYFGCPPLANYIFDNLNISCKKIKIKVRFTALDQVHTFLENNSYYHLGLSTINVGVTSKDSTKDYYSRIEMEMFAEVDKNVYEAFMPITGTICEFNFRFYLDFLYKLEILEFGYVV